MGKLLFILLSLFCASIVFFGGEIILFSYKVYFSSMVIQIFSLFWIFSDKNTPYSLQKIFYLFAFFFFGIAPLVQFNQQVTLFNARKLSENECLFMNILIIFIMIIFQLFYNFFSLRPLRKADRTYVNKFRIRNKIRTATIVKLFALSTFSFIVFLWYNNFNILSMLIRGGELKEYNEETSSSFMLVITQTIRPISMIVLFYYLISPKRDIKVSIVFFLIALITCFPLGMPRFFAGALYIPLLLISFPFIKKGYAFSLFFILSLLIIFPFLNSFRDFSNDTEIALSIDYEMFATGHFDSYQNFALIVLEDIITWGRQLLGVLFFWLPRTLWADKPVGSGAMIAKELHLSFDNISANYFAEGYVNFGFFGIFVFIITLAYFSAIMDKLYWKLAHFSENNLFKIMYYIMLGMLFFVMRGDLLSSFAFTIGYLLSYYIVIKTAKN